MASKDKMGKEKSPANRQSKNRRLMIHATGKDAHLSHQIRLRKRRQREINTILVDAAMQGYAEYLKKVRSGASSDERQRYRDIQPLKTILVLVAFLFLWLGLCLLLCHFLSLCIQLVAPL